MEQNRESSKRPKVPSQFNRKMKVFLKNVTGTTGYEYQKKLDLNPYLTSYIKN